MALSPEKAIIHTGELDVLKDQLYLLSLKNQQDLAVGNVKEFHGSISSLSEFVWADFASWWLDVAEPDIDDIDALTRAFNLHPLTKHDISSPGMHEKISFFSHYYSITSLQYCPDKTSDTTPVHIHLLIFNSGVLNVHFSGSSSTKHWRTVMQCRLSSMFEGPQIVCLDPLSETTHRFKPLVQAVKLEAEAIEDSLFSARDGRDLCNTTLQISACRKRSQEVLRLLCNKVHIFQTLAKPSPERFSAIGRENHLYWIGLRDQTFTMISNLSYTELVLSRAHACYLAQINVTTLAGSNRALGLFTRLTFVTSTTIAIYGIVSIFSMNVAIPGMNSDTYHFFIAILGIVTAALCGMILIAKKLL
ncbi:hypothetical protein PMZ80_011172 [Knufia obscura]|uniref:Uncharacterized protein n=2 Tax=Knufia TaxID=430999 RepID=A0AAN8EWW7_9EURO|nr:hypothetical protein PMZ80_011172 [Knufia obscura]KAK5947831.1 hypothetical protein OHC33_011147 [Knufia fluminis]